MEAAPTEPECGSLYSSRSWPIASAIVWCLSPACCIYGSPSCGDILWASCGRPLTDHVAYAWEGPRRSIQSADVLPSVIASQ
jgi:hypothetical protein